MAYRLKASESIPEGIMRVVGEEIDSATDQLNRGGAKKRDEAVHEARKSIKKIRGVLRLLQPELGRVYANENGRFREIGRKLSEIRDAKAIIDVFDSLLEKHNDSLRKDALISIRRGLEKSKRETEEANDLDKVVQRAISTLRGAGRRVKTWPVNGDGFKTIAPGLENTYRRGRRAMVTARKDPAPENYHDWRKRVKDHWYHVRLLEDLWTDVMQAHEASLKNLETWLGDDHNLVVLCGKLHDEPEKYGQEKDIQLFLTLASQHQKELRENAISLGERIYEEKPRQFTQNISNLWDTWQRQPESMKEVEDEQRAVAKKRPANAGAGKTETAVA